MLAVQVLFQAANSFKIQSASPISEFKIKEMTQCLERCINSYSEITMEASSSEAFVPFLTGTEGRYRISAMMIYM